VPMNEEFKNILSKVLCLYMKYGIKSVTMDDVAHELGISKKTLYQYVSDKNELVSKVVDIELEEKGKPFDEIYNGNLNAVEEAFEVHKVVNKLLRSYNPSTEYDLKKYYPVLYSKIAKVRRERMYNHIFYNLKKGKEEGLYRSELNEEFIAKIQLSRIENAFDNGIFTQEEMLSPKLFFEFFIYHIRGIANEKGIAILEQKLKELGNINI
jgi:TetR/AcrR family transcriptional regulator, cholesterol catabolism regulator